MKTSIPYTANSKTFKKAGIKLVQYPDPKAIIFGDVLFSMINYARFLKINPETALERTNKKFMERFTHIESKASEAGKKINELSLAEMEVYWQQAKSKD